MTMPSIGLEPAAAPTLPGIEPQNVGLNLQELAAGLSQFAPALANFGGMLAERKAAGDEQAGKDAARKMYESVKSYRQAIKQGLIAPGQSPWYRVGVKEEFGRLLADRYNSDLTAAMAQSPDIQGATDLSAFDRFEGTFRKQWLEQNVGQENQDAYFNKGFGPLADTYLGAQRAEMAQRIARNIEQSGYDLQFSRTLNVVRSEMAKGTSADAIGASIQQMADDWVRLGANGTQVQQATADAIISAAESMNDLTVLDLLDKVGGGPGGSKLSSTSYVAGPVGPDGISRLEKAQQEISSELSTKDAREHERRQHEQDDRVQAIASEAAQRLSQAPDPHTVDLSDLRGAMGRADPTKVQLLYQMQDAYSAHEYTDDPDVKSHLFMRVYGLDDNNPGFLTSEQAAHYLAARQITPATFNDLIAKMQERKDNAQKGLTQAFNDPGLKAAQKAVQDLFVAWMPQGIDDPAMRWRAVATREAITHSYLLWRNAQGKDASPDKINTWITHEARRLFFTASDSPTAEQFKEIAEPFFGTQGESSTKLLVDPNRLDAMVNDFEAWKLHQKSNLDPETLAVLSGLGVPMTIDDITKFIRDQYSVQGKMQPAASPSPKTP